MRTDRASSNLGAGAASSGLAGAVADSGAGRPAGRSGAGATGATSGLALGSGGLAVQTYAGVILAADNVGILFGSGSTDFLRF